ncbi:MAG: tRNA (adenine(22)-N(1))-methyltransferase [Chitinophagales bacterium]
MARIKPGIYLPSRLAELTSYIIPGEPMADIGSDHALLPCFLINQGICPRAIIGELTTGPFIRAQKTISLVGLTDRIETRQGDGLDILSPGEVSTVVIAGIGAATITGILDRAGKKIESFKRLVLQPMGTLRDLRAFIAARGWLIEAENVIKDTHYYVSISINPVSGPLYNFSDLEMEFGPRILERHNESAIRDYLEYHLRKYQKIILQTSPVESSRAKNAVNIYKDRKIRLEEVLK